MHRPIRFAFAASCSIVLAGLSACDPSGPRGGVASVTISPPDASVGYQQRLQLMATARDADGDVVTGLNVRWVTSDSAIARVDGSGMLTGLAPGSVVVTVEVENVAGSSEVVVTPLGFAAVDAREFRTCGITLQAEAYCWGNGERGQLGNGTTDTSAVAVPVSGGHTFTTLAVGLTPCGLVGVTAYCWGEGSWGQLGGGQTTAVQLTPEPVAGGLAFDTLAGGYGHACGVVAGTAYCWGRNDAGQLGSPGSERCNGPYCSTTPIVVTDTLAFTMITTGGGHTCALGTAGAAYCWGADGSGALGDGPREPQCNGGFPCSTEPVAVAGNLTFSTLSAGLGHVCGLTSAGAAYCWGWGADGQLGDGATEDRTEPTQVAAPVAFTAIAAGRDHTCALAESGAVYCWGRGFRADGSFGVRSAPVALAGGLLFRTITAGWRTSCGIAHDDTLYCWGVNLFGTVGDGTRTDRPAPVPVHGQ